MRILINGRAGAGKDVIADYLVDKYDFIQFSFADGIYEVAYNIFGMTQKDRKLLQDIGEKMREIDPNVWVDHVVKRILELPEDTNIVVSDCRQENEHEALVYGLDFTGIQVYADKELRKERITKRDGAIPDMSLLEVPSETGADNLRYDYLIENTDDLSDLYKAIDNIIQFERGNF